MRGWIVGIVLLFGSAVAAAPLRTQVTAAELSKGNIAGPVSMQAFAPPAGATAPTRSFEGRLTLDRPTFDGGFEVVRNAPYNIPVDTTTRSLPAFDFAFVQDGNVLLPVQRGAIIGSHRDWEWTLEPGSVWGQAHDDGLTRAALPFSLRERGANCLHNGVLTFLFGDKGVASQVYYQVSSETCAYFKFNAWGSATAHYRPGAIGNAAQVRASWREERASRLPVKPLADLTAAHPGVAADAFALARPADGDVPTLFGAVVNGVNYTGGCDTRAGPYPYCDVLDLPSYSTAKSVLAAIGLMRLEKLWPGARSAMIADYVPQCATADWKDVTFEDALNMVTGVYGDPGFEVDEDSADESAFFNADTHAGKIAFACSKYHKRSPPGTTWVYHTIDTYILGAAMQAFVRRKLGPGADLYRDIHGAQLWHKLHLSPVVDATLRTYDSAAQFFSGYGLTYHRDDIARIAGFLSSGELDGDKALDGAIRARALERDPAHRGVPAGIPNFVYADGLWARNLAPLLGCSRDAYVPFMSGFGGISVVMLPHDVVYYYFGDSQVWDWGPAAKEIDKIKPVCP